MQNLKHTRTIKSRKTLVWVMFSDFSSDAYRYNRSRLEDGNSHEFFTFTRYACGYISEQTDNASSMRAIIEV